MEKYIKQIENTNNLDTLNDIIEGAAYDDNLTNTEYCQIADTALDRARKLGYEYVQWNI